MLLTVSRTMEARFSSSLFYFLIYLYTIVNMKYMPSQLFFFLQSKTIQRNIQVLFKFLFGIVMAIIVYSVLFHFIMEYEGKQHSWVTGFYWTLTVMSTLGFGDITFSSDLQKATEATHVETDIQLIKVKNRTLPVAFRQNQLKTYHVWFNKNL